MMKYFKDGDALCITKDDFEDLQASPVVFLSLEDPRAKIIMTKGFKALPLNDLATIKATLDAEEYRR